MSKALAVALGRGPDDPARSELAAILTQLPGQYGDLVTEWQRLAQLGAGDRDVAALARLLRRHGEHDPALAEKLRHWARGTLRNAFPATEHADHHNVMDGSGQTWGMAVQARDVLGGIHLHQQVIRPPVPRQLLPVPAHFTGREKDLAALPSAGANCPRNCPNGPRYGVR